MSDGDLFLHMRGELHPQSGTELQQDVELIIAVYPSPDQAFGRAFAWSSTADFLLDLPSPPVSPTSTVIRKIDSCQSAGPGDQRD